MSVTCCPVCGFDGLKSKSLSQCPQCNADLTCFAALEALCQELPAAATASSAAGAQGSPKQALSARVGLVLLTLLIGIGLGVGLSVLKPDKLWRYPQQQVKLQLQTQASSQNIEQKKYDDLLRRYTELNQTSSQTTTVDKVRTTAFFLYPCRNIDTLWDIAKQFYGKGKYYPIILEHNPNLSIYDLGTGVSLRISLNLLRNRDQVDNFYKQITETIEGQVYWYYTISPGDTLSSITRKFYAAGSSISIISDLNLNVAIKPGNKLKIIME